MAERQVHRTKATLRPQLATVKSFPTGRLMSKLHERYEFEDDQYFYDGECSQLTSVSLSCRIGFRRLIRVSTRYLQRLQAKSVIGFTDRRAGWRGVATSRKFMPIELSLPEFATIARTRLYFRDAKGYADNYYFTDNGLSWFIVFCHEGDWHLFAQAGRSLATLSLR